MLSQGKEADINQSHKYVSQPVLSTREENMVLYKDVKEETDLVRRKVRELYRAEICDEGFLYFRRWTLYLCFPFNATLAIQPSFTGSRVYRYFWNFTGISVRLQQQIS